MKGVGAMWTWQQIQGFLGRFRRELLVALALLGVSSLTAFAMHKVAIVIPNPCTELVRPTVTKGEVQLANGNLDQAGRYASDAINLSQSSPCANELVAAVEFHKMQLANANNKPAEAEMARSRCHKHALVARAALSTAPRAGAYLETCGAENGGREIELAQKNGPSIRGSAIEPVSVRQRYGEACNCDAGALGGIDRLPRSALTYRQAEAKMRDSDFQTETAPPVETQVGTVDEAKVVGAPTHAQPIGK
jgi:hypothetical protein